MEAVGLQVNKSYFYRAKLGKMRKRGSSGKGGEEKSRTGTAVAKALRWVGYLTRMHVRVCVHTTTCMCAEASRHPVSFPVALQFVYFS